MSDAHDEVEYVTRDDANLAILRAYGEMTFLERNRLLIVNVAKVLIEAGVDFSKCREPIA